METSEGNPIKILYADDDVDDRDFFQDALTEAKSDAELTTVEDGDKLMKYLATVNGNYPDIIFLDINMPCKDGKICLKEIREIEELKKIPVIMFSTSSHPTDIEETFKNGANLFISKTIFFNNQVKFLSNIFALNWQKELLKHDINRFVLNTSKGFM